MTKSSKDGSNADELKSAVDELNSAWNAVASKMYEAAKETDTSKETKSKAKSKTKKKDDAEIEDADFEVVD